jgi:hypothetical protein
MDKNDVQQALLEAAGRAAALARSALADADRDADEDDHGSPAALERYANAAKALAEAAEVAGRA